MKKFQWAEWMKNLKLSENLTVGCGEKPNAKHFKYKIWALGSLFLTVYEFSKILQKVSGIMIRLYSPDKVVERPIFNSSRNRRG